MIIVIRIVIITIMIITGARRHPPRQRAAGGAREVILAIFYPFSQFCEINVFLQSLQKQPNTAPNLFQRAAGGAGEVFYEGEHLRGI